MGKWIGLLAVGGAVALGATAINRRMRKKVKWNRIWDDTVHLLANKSVKRGLRKGRRLLKSWT